MYVFDFAAYFPWAGKATKTIVDQDIVQLLNSFFLAFSAMRAFALSQSVCMAILILALYAVPVILNFWVCFYPAII